MFLENVRRLGSPGLYGFLCSAVNRSFRYEVPSEGWEGWPLELAGTRGRQIAPRRDEPIAFTTLTFLETKPPVNNTAC